MFLRCLGRKNSSNIVDFPSERSHIFFARKTAEKKLQQQILKYFF